MQKVRKEFSNQLKGKHNMNHETRSQKLDPAQVVWQENRNSSPIFLLIQPSLCPWFTFDREYPSYMWNRPCIITQDLPFRNPNTSRPAWPCTAYRKGKKSKVIGTCFFSQYSGGRSRRVCQFKASLDYIASSRPARDTRWDCFKRKIDHTSLYSIH